jgi:hypothetical protein
VVVAELGTLYHPARKEVELGEGKTKVTLELNPAFGSLSVGSEPRGAEVWLDDKKVGVTPWSNPQLGSGTYALRLTQADYHEATAEVTVEDGGDVRKTIELKPAFGTLTVTSEPSGAEVRIDGQRVGVTPWKDARRPSGDYDVRVVLPDYLKDSAKVTVRDGKKATHHAQLEANFGRVEVVSDPPGAAIKLNGEVTGKVTPQTFTKVRAGVIEVELSLEGYGDRVVRKKLKRGGELTVRESLDAKLGHVSVLVTDNSGVMCEAKVSVDGVEQPGTTPMKLTLPAKSYELSVKCGGGRASKTIAVVHNESQRVELQAGGRWVAAVELVKPGACHKDIEVGVESRAGRMIYLLGGAWSWVALEKKDGQRGGVPPGGISLQMTSGEASGYSLRAFDYPGSELAGRANDYEVSGLDVLVPLTEPGRVELHLAHPKFGTATGAVRLASCQVLRGRLDAGRFPAVPALAEWESLRQKQSRPAGLAVAGLFSGGALYAVGVMFRRQAQAAKNAAALAQTGADYEEQVAAVDAANARFVGTMAAGGALITAGVVGAVIAGAQAKKASAAKARYEALREQALALDEVVEWED